MASVCPALWIQPAKKNKSDLSWKNRVLPLSLVPQLCPLQTARLVPTQEDGSSCPSYHSPPPTSVLAQCFGKMSPLSGRRCRRRQSPG